jgi:hypothetical protein
MTELISEAFILIASSALIYLVFNESLVTTKPVLQKYVWGLLFPTYLIVMINSIVAIFFTGPLTHILTGVSFSIFIYSSILFAILLTIIKFKQSAVAKSID